MEFISKELLQSIQKLHEATAGVFNFVNDCAKQTHDIAVRFKALFPPQWFDFLKEERQRIAELKALDLDGYNNYYKNKIENAEFLGKHGWVLTPYSGINTEQYIVARLKKGATEKNCTKYFFENQKHILASFDNTRKLYSNESLFYYDEFVKQFKKRDYTAASFYISALVDNRMKHAFKTRSHQKYSKIIKEGIALRKKLYFEKSKLADNYYSSVFILTEYLPSFYQYAERTFTEDSTHDMDLGCEPEYFNRNWLMHGKRTKPVERYEVLQIYNALLCLEAIIDALQDYDILQTMEQTNEI